MVSLLLDFGDDSFAESENETFFIEEGTTYDELLDLIEDAKSVNGCNFTGWEYGFDEFVGTDVVDTTWIIVVATYDNYPVRIERAYIDKNGDVAYDEVVKNYPAGTDMEDVWAEWTTTPEDASTEYEIVEWVGEYPQGEVGIYNYYIYATAMYDEMVIVTFNVEHIEDCGEYGEYGVEFIYVAIPREECTADYLTEYCEDEIVANMSFNHYKELEFDEWVYNVLDWDEDGACEVVSVCPDYNFSEVITLYAYSMESLRIYVVEPGETITLPTEEAGYEITWWDEANNEYVGSYTVSADLEAGAMIFLYAVTGDKVEVTPTPGTPSTPEVGMDDEKIDEVVTEIEDAIEDAKDSDETVKVEIDMTNEDGTVATVVPEEILEAIKGEDVEIVLDMGDYTWTINGKDVGDKLTDINLEVIFDTDEIPEAVVEKIAGSNDCFQISLTHDGEFGFTATLTINVGKEYAGKYINLYYYNEKGELEAQCSGLVDKDGNVELAFSHASDYLLVVSDKPISTSPITEETVDIALYVTILLSGAGLALVGLKKRR